jgi:hypothetical protein
MTRTVASRIAKALIAVCLGRILAGVAAVTAGVNARPALNARSASAPAK